MVRAGPSPSGVVCCQMSDVRAGRPTGHATLLGSGTVNQAMQMSQSVLVTGGAGYIGSHACKVLARAGYQPVVFDNLSRGHREAVRWGPLIEGDLADRNRLIMALETHRIMAVMHFAAFAYVGESVADPAMYYRNNLGGSLSLMEAMRETGVDKIVFSSSCPPSATRPAIRTQKPPPNRQATQNGKTKSAMNGQLNCYGKPIV